MMQLAHNSVSGGRFNLVADRLAVANMIWQANRSERAMTVLRCVTASRLATGPTIF
jgi:hypothetical protein